MLRARAAAAAEPAPRQRAGGSADGGVEGHPDQVEDRRHRTCSGTRCARSACSGSATWSSRRTGRRSAAWSRRCATWSPSRRWTDMADEDGEREGPRRAEQVPARQPSRVPAAARRPAGLKIHHLRPAPGRAHRADPGRPRPGVQGQDRWPRHQGHQGPRTRCRRASRAARCRCTRRVPKLRGFSNLRFKTTYQVVNLDRLAELYPRRRGCDARGPGRQGRGACRRAGQGARHRRRGVSGLRVTAHEFSATAREKITAAGGTVTEL